MQYERKLHFHISTVCSLTDRQNIYRIDAHKRNLHRKNIQTYGRTLAVIDTKKNQIILFKNLKHKKLNLSKCT